MKEHCKEREHKEEDQDRERVRGLGTEQERGDVPCEGAVPHPMTAWEHGGTTLLLGTPWLNGQASPGG